MAVISFDIARDLLDPDLFITTGTKEDGVALEREESAPQVHTALAIEPDSLVAPPERTIYQASLDPARASSIGLS